LEPPEDLQDTTVTPRHLEYLTVKISNLIRMKKKILTVMTITSLTACNQSKTKDNKVISEEKKTLGMVEITTFKLKNSISNADFIKSAEQMQNDFLKRQEGFIKRTLTQSGDSLWTDIVYWKSKESHNKAMQLAEKTEAVVPFMEKIDFSSVKMNLTNPILDKE
jgi:heme-degrading monooxygenase HmoA